MYILLRYIVLELKMSFQQAPMCIKYYSYTERTYLLRHSIYIYIYVCIGICRFIALYMRSRFESSLIISTMPIRMGR